MYIYNARILIFIFIDFLAVNKYIYIPPNIHSNSTSYSWPIIIKKFKEKLHVGTNARWLY